MSKKYDFNKLTKGEVQSGGSVKKLETLEITPSEKSVIMCMRETDSDTPVSSLISTDRSLTKIKAENKALKMKYEQAERELEVRTRQLSTLIDMNSGKQLTTIKAPPSKSKNKKNNSTAFMIASDWHIEEYVDPMTINGMNRFDLDIGKERVKYFFENGLALVDLNRNGTNINTLVLAFLGDLISGYIHEELLESNTLSPTKAIIHLQSLITSGIDFLLENGKFEKIIVPCSLGNHGRTTQKYKISTAADNSYEWLLYKNLEIMYQNDDRIDIIVLPSYHTYLDVYNDFRIRFHHGNNIRYGGGVGGITIPVKKAIHAWNKERYAQLDVFGHFHQLFDGNTFISNGSLVGYNSFANSIKAEYEPPRQSFFLINEKFGKTITAPIILEKV